MIGFEYKGQVSYITRMDDFRDIGNQKFTKLFGKPLKMVAMADCDRNMRSYRLNMMNCKQSMTSSKMR